MWSALRDHGLSFETEVKVFPSSRRTVDIAFSVDRIAVFIDGCFWHSCPEHGTQPKANRDWWGEKLEENVKRDRAATIELQGDGWTVLRIWGHVPPQVAAEQIEDALMAVRSVSRQA